MPADDSAFPSLPQTSATAEGFVPAGWELEKKVEGDLDGDGDADLVLVLRKKDPHNIVPVNSYGCRAFWNTNPRILAMAFYKSATHNYALSVATHTLIPREGLPIPNELLGNPWDPLDHVAIAQGKLMVTLSHGAESDWGHSFATYTFRFRSTCFQQIGYDSLEDDTKLDTSGTSINYLTGKQKDSGMRQGHDYVRWANLGKKPLTCMEEIGKTK